MSVLLKAALGGLHSVSPWFVMAGLARLWACLVGSERVYLSVGQGDQGQAAAVAAYASTCSSV